MFSLNTHSEFFSGADHGEAHEAEWPLPLALVTLAVVTVLVALVSEVFVESVQQAATALGLSPAFVGFIVVALVGGAAEMVSAWSAAGKNRLDLSVGIALGSAVQIALFVAPVLVLLSYGIGPQPIDLEFWHGAVAMMFIATMTASLVTNTGRSAWFIGVLVVMIYVVFALTLYLWPLALLPAVLAAVCLVAGLLAAVYSIHWVEDVLVPGPDKVGTAVGFVLTLLVWIGTLASGLILGLAAGSRRVPKFPRSCRRARRSRSGERVRAAPEARKSVAQRAGAKKRSHPSLFLAAVMIPIVSVLMAAHTIEVMVWASAYALVDAAPENVQLVYFAFVNYATLGYGDIVPVDRWKLLGPLTAMNGALMFGWSTAVIFEVLRRSMERSAITLGPR